METKADIPSIDRLKFFNGQKLTANDLAELQRAQRELRWLHNRSVHGWGIGVGLAVTGEAGDSAVMIKQGYAVDCLGREIILTEQQTVTVPSIARESTYFLVAGYQPDEEQKVAERRPGVCAPAGTVRLSEEPRIEWKTAAQLNEGKDIVLAQAKISNCQLSQPLSLAPRRYARPASQPYIAAGQTTNDEKTKWDRVEEEDNSVIIITRQVDTSAARFRSTPYYQAHVAGDRHFWSAWQNKLILINGITSVANASPTGFRIQVQIKKGQIALPIADDELLVIINDELQWHVVWMGIEG